MALKAQSSEPVRDQARSMVISRFGIVATSQTLASEAGAQVLEAGGNAIDAAIAANAVLGLVEPNSNGIGGDLFAIVYEAKSGKLHGLNASGWSPSGLTREFLGSKGITQMPYLGIHSVTVPGCVAGWEELRKRFGTLPLSKLLAAAIYYAEEGFPVTEIIASSWGTPATVDFLRSHANSKNTYLPGGHAPETGEVFRNPDLAASLRSIASHGRDGFYKGRVAEAMVAISQQMGGTLAEADLSEFHPEWVEPMMTTYRGWKIYEVPPNGQGIAALSMLNLMERFPLPEYGHNSAKALHAMIEAKKLAYADLLRYVGDPRFSRIPAAEMLSKELAAERAKLIRPDRASCRVAPSELKPMTRVHGGDTIYLSAIDKAGNIVSFIQSNYAGFGCGLVPPKTGFMLQNRGALFTFERDHPNVLAPRKRPLHTIIPAFMEKDGVRIGFGIMGGWNQAQAHAQFVSKVVDFGMSIQAALETPRFTKHTFEGCDVGLERRIPISVRQELERMGHEVEDLPPYSGMVGGGQAVMRDGKGVNYAGSDPRKDGAAVPEGPPVFGNQVGRSCVVRTP
ncbi:MAG: gamma-glutamyltransferase [Acidimicrobiia bacterium]|nr:gamma-glutamyltransferase [Acidimicrobiia bacterium]